MKQSFLCLLFACVFYMTAAAQGRQNVYVRFSGDNALPDTLQLQYSGLEPTLMIKGSATLFANKEEVIWNIKINQPLFVQTNMEYSEGAHGFIVAPGDSLVVRVQNGKLKIDGKGATKNILFNRLFDLRSKRPLSNPIAQYTVSVADYKEWQQYYLQELEKSLKVIDSVRNDLDPFIYKWIRVSYIMLVQEKMHDKFRGLYSLYVKHGDSLRLTSNELCRIFDSTFLTGNFKWMRAQPIGAAADHGFIKDYLYRQHSFPRKILKDRIDMDSTIKKYETFYKLGKLFYSGAARENYFKELMTSELIYDIGYKSEFTPDVENLLAKYYRQSKFPGVKKYVQDYENRYRLKKVSPGNHAPAFSIVSSSDLRVTEDSLKGKITVLVIPGSSATQKQKAKQISDRVLSIFKDDPYVKVVNIGDFNQNKKTAARMRKNYLPGNEEAIFLIDRKGKILLTNFDIASFYTDSLIAEIKVEYVKLYDGPYIERKENKTNVLNFFGYAMQQHQISDSAFIRVQSDDYGKPFNIRLNKHLQNEPSEFKQPEKLVMFSDIEGNFDKLKKLLLHSGVIDEQFNWTFGSGHVVFAGDMVDRGEQVTECLWLMYSLENKAKYAGGYVHYILGNHEIMTLSGNNKYASEKYKINAQRAGKTYKDFFEKDTELGKWLRTKNIMVKVGNMLFVHAGLADQFNDLGLTIQEVNEMARPYYDKDDIAKRSPDKNIATIFKPETSPFWYRQYYKERLFTTRPTASGFDTSFKTPVSVIDRSLKKYGVDHIVTGHTLYKGDVNGQYITSHYGGKVINLDTKHAKGFSEALLVEDGLFYRITSKGEKIEFIMKTDSHTSIP